MTCPKCSHPQPDNESQFCSQCGFPIESAKQSLVTASRTEAPETEKQKDPLSPRQKGMRQGVKLMLLSIVLIPAYVLLAALFPANDVLVESHVSDTAFEKISEAVLLTIFLCGLVRTLYAYFFERSDNDDTQQEKETAQLHGASTRYALPPSQSIPVSGFGAWRSNTGEVVQPAAKRKHTGESFEKEETPRDK
jgi:hypothetical protein